VHAYLPEKIVELNRMEMLHGTLDKTLAHCDSINQLENNQAHAPGAHFIFSSSQLHLATQLDAVIWHLLPAHSFNFSPEIEKIGE
jgi:hypothetical protein